MLFSKDYIELKRLIENAIQRNNDFIYFKGIKMNITTSNRLLKHGLDIIKIENKKVPNV